MTLNHGHNASGQINSTVASDDFYLPSPAVASTAYVADKQNRYSSIGGTAATHNLNGACSQNAIGSIAAQFAYD